MAVNSLGTYSSAVNATSWNTTGLTQPTNGAIVFAHIGFTTSGGAISDAPTAFTGFGATFTRLAQMKASAGATRNVLVYAALAASYTSTQIAVTWGQTVDDACIEVIEETAPVGATIGAIVAQTEYIITTANGTSITGNVLPLQSTSNRVICFVSAGDNGLDINVGAGETGWTRHANIGPSMIISLGCMSQVGNGDLTPTMSWATAASPTVCTLEVRLASGDTYPLGYVRLGEGASGTNASGTTAVTGNIVTSATISTTLDSAVLTSTSQFFDDNFVGASISGNANIPGGTTVSSVDSERQITMSANATGTGTAATTFTGVTIPFTSGQPVIMGIVGRRTAAPQTPSSVVTTTGSNAFTLIDSVTYNTDWTVQHYYYVPASTFDSTVTITWPASATGGTSYAAVGLTGHDAALVTANEAENTGSAVTSLDVTMGAYGDARNGVIAAYGGIGDVGNGILPASGLVVAARYPTTREISLLFGRSNIATVSSTFASSSVGGTAVELVGAAAAGSSQPPRSMHQFLRRRAA